MRAQLERQHEIMQGQDQPIGTLQEIQHHIDQLKSVANLQSKNRHLLEPISQQDMVKYLIRQSSARGRMGLSSLGTCVQTDKLTQLLYEILNSQ